MEDDLRGYLQQRFNVESRLAESSIHPQAVRAHRDLASLYLSRLNEIERGGERPSPHTAN